METVCSRTVSKIPILQLFPKFECVESFVASLIKYFDMFKIRLLLPNKLTSSEDKTRSITIAVYCLEMCEHVIVQEHEENGNLWDIYSKCQVVITYM